MKKILNYLPAAKNHEQVKTTHQTKFAVLKNEDSIKTMMHPVFRKPSCRKILKRLNFKLSHVKI